MKIIVGVSDMKASDDPSATLITYSLGSCIGVAVYDSVAKVGGLLHYMLPESSLDGVKAQNNPFMFADTGIPALFKEAYRLGAKKQRMKVVVVGGAQILDQKGFFNIGKRNHMAVRKIFWKNQVMIDHEDVGGSVNRTIRIDIATGEINIKVSGVGENDRMNAIQDLIKEIKNLKPIPQIANQIMAIVENPNASLSDVADIILYDPMTTANILRTCNSAYFGLSRKVESVHEAVTLLGLEQIVDLVLLKSGAENLKKEQTGYGLNEGDLWRYSVSSALIARGLAEKRHLASKHMIFTAALLKDIGKVILNRFVGDSFQKINDLVQNQGMSFKEAEKKIIGVDHAELGGLVASNWKFSPKMVYIIQHHHLSDPQAREDEETCLVYLSDIICMMMGIGGGADGLAYRFHDEVFTRLGFTERDLQETIAGFGEQMAKVEDLIKSV